MTLCQVFVFLSGVVSMVKTVLSMIGSILCLSACQVGVNPPSYVRPWTPAVAATVLPTPTESTPVPVPTAWPRYVASPPKASALPELAPSPGVSADEGQAVTGPAVVCCAGTVASGASGGSGGSATSDGFFISDVVLAETGESVMGEGALAAIQVDYEVQDPIRLQLLGHFPAALSEEKMRFTYAPGVVTQTFSGDLPDERIVLQDALILEPQTVSTHAITVLLPGFSIPDLQTRGLLELVLTSGQMSRTVFLNFGVSFVPDHFPLIEQVETHASEELTLLKVKGKNFFLNPEANQCWWDDMPLTSYQTQILWNGTSQLWLKLDTTPDSGIHQLRCQTPRGINQWEGEL